MSKRVLRLMKYNARRLQCSRFNRKEQDDRKTTDWIPFINGKNFGFIVLIFNVAFYLRMECKVIPKMPYKRRNRFAKNLDSALTYANQKARHLFKKIN